MFGLIGGRAATKLHAHRFFTRVCSSSAGRQNDAPAHASTDASLRLDASVLTMLMRKGFG